MLEGKNNWKAWLYLLPALILLGIFSFYPIVKSFIIAFIRDYNPVSNVFKDNIAANKEAGLSLFTFKNFITVFKNAHFKDAVVNTLLIAFISVPISVVLSLVISVLLVSIKKMRGFFQTLFFIPYVTSAMAVAMAFTVLFANAGNNVNGLSPGPVNAVLRATGLEKPLVDSFDKAEWKRKGKENWCDYIFYSDCDKNGIPTADAVIDEAALEAAFKREKSIAERVGDDFFATKEEFQASRMADTNSFNEKRYHFRTLGYIDWVGSQATWNTCITIVLLYSIWGGMAFKILVFTGGLTGIDKQYYDAAKIDNTTKWRTFWKITVPMLSPLIVYILITSLIGSFKTYTSIVGLFGDTLGPSGQSGLMTTFVGLVYQYMGQGNELIHVGAASAVTLFLIIFVITQLTNRFTKKRVHY